MSESAGEGQGRGRVRRPAPLVAISTTYGAGGGLVGERVAHALGVPFLGHSFTSEEMARAHRPGAANPAAGFLRHRTRGDQALDDTAAAAAFAELGSRSFFDESDAEVLALVRTGGVVVGRAGPYVLRDEPGVLHVLLDGPTDARIAAGAHLEGVDNAIAAERQLAHDESRLGIARHHYGAEPNDLRYYSMVLDSIALGLDTVTDLIVRAARAVQQATEAGPAS